jgi:hypothetical protein
MANYGSRRRMVRLKFLFKPSEASACGGFKSAVVLQLDLPGGQKWALAETACCDQTASARPLIRHVEKTKCPLQRTTTLINTLLSFFFSLFPVLQILQKIASFLTHFLVGAAPKKVTGGEMHL